MKAAVPVCLLLAGVVATIAIPNFLNAVSRGRQKRTMADAISIGTAIESYKVDFGFVPGAQSVDELARLLEPTYSKKMPLVDGWGTPYRVETWTLEGGVNNDGPARAVLVPGPANAYLVRAACKDRAWDFEDPLHYSLGVHTSFDRDILYGGIEYFVKAEELNRPPRYR